MISLLFALAVSAQAQIEFVPKDVVKQWIERFEHTPPLKSITAVKNTVWNCTLLGAQTRLQQQTFADFYSFHGERSLSNTGTHFIKDFQLNGEELQGQNEQIVESVRLTQGHQLLIQVRAKDDKRILATGMCVLNILRRPVLI